MKNIYYAWEDFSNDIKIISGRITQKEFVPDIILGIKRGGVCFATSLSYMLNKPVQFVESDEDLRKFSGNILIADDICDSGETFEKITNNIKNYKTTSLFFNVKQNFNVDYFARKIDRDYEKSWIVFPWEMNT